MKQENTAFPAADADRAGTALTDAGGLPARQAAFTLIDAVLSRRQAFDEALEKSGAFAGIEQARDRGFAHLMALTVLRRLGQIDQLIDRYMAHQPKGKAQSVRNVLRLGVAQIIFIGTPAHAAVDTTVALAEAQGLEGFKGLVNAILRKVAREGGDFARRQDAARLNIPAWLRDGWLASYGDAATRALGEAHLLEPSLDISVKNPADIQDWAEKLGGSVLEAAGTIRLSGSARDVRTLPGFDSGDWWVQDAAAALPARLLAEAMGDLRGRNVLDLCAAPGGKTAQLAAMGAQVTAVDRSAPRLNRLHDNLARLSLSADVIEADVGQWRPDQLVEAILLDAPCSATGTLRRHPDIAYLKSEKDVTRLADLQRRLILAASEMLVPGGVLVFATCSLQTMEGEEVIQAALDEGAPFDRITDTPTCLGGFSEAFRPDGSIRTLPYQRASEGGCDGFFITRLKRR